MTTTIECPEPLADAAKDFKQDLDEELEFLWQDCDTSGNAYDLYIGRISRSPIVRSRATGKYFMLPWSRIIELAAERGLNRS